MPRQVSHSHEHKPGYSPNLIVHEMAWVGDVSTDNVWKWLALGWRDLKANWAVSLTYASLFVFLGVFISFGFYFLGWPYFILPAISGFLLVGPAAGIGFYEISRRHSAGENSTIFDAIFAYRRNTLGIMGLGLVMVFLLQVWIRLSFTIFSLSFPGVMPEWTEIITRFLSMEGVYFAFSITALGSVFAAAVFFSSAFAMPMLLDRKTVLLPSLITSAYAVGRNKSAMLLWAGLIVVFTGIGLATAFVGLIITLPLIGHATWHAYKDTLPGEAS